MGGLGSGRQREPDVKSSTEAYRSIDVRSWKRDGLLESNQSFDLQWSRHGEVVASIRVRAEPGRLMFTCRHRSGGTKWEGESYPVYLDWTVCNLGGRRPWFLCPARDCGRRVAILYGGPIFACRHCHQLVYPSQRDAADNRAARRADRIREKLGWEPGILNGEGLKPKGMHRQTFKRLAAQHNALAQIALAGIAAKLDRLEDSLNGCL